MEPDSTWPVTIESCFLPQFLHQAVDIIRLLKMSLSTIDLFIRITWVIVKAILGPCFRPIELEFPLGA